MSEEPEEGKAGAIAKSIDRLAAAIESVTSAIKERPEPTLAALVIAAPPVLLMMGVNPWVSLLGPLGVYILYCVRSERAEKHLERMADRRVEEIQADGDRKIAELAEKYLKRLPEGGKDDE